MFNKMPKLDDSEHAFGIIGWLFFVLGMTGVLGIGGLFLGIGIPCILSICFDRIRVVVYNGNEE